MRTLQRLLVTAALLAGCGDDTSDSGGGGEGSEGGGEPTWAEYCEGTYCALREEQAADLNCGHNPAACEAECEQEEECAAELRAVSDCAAAAELVCDIATDRVTVELGECTAELNALYLCSTGECETLTDTFCEPVVCEDGTPARMCGTNGACVSDAAAICDSAVACTSENYVDVCPTLGCNGESVSGCTAEGFCQTTCDD